MWVRFILAKAADGAPHIYCQPFESAMVEPNGHHAPSPRQCRRMEAMDDVTIARALHVVFVVLWIGGVAFVTTALLPALRRLKTPHERMQLFDQIERRFAWQARISTAIRG